MALGSGDVYKRQLHDQAVLQPQEAHQKMLLVDLLVSIFISQLLAALDGLH